MACRLRMLSIVTMMWSGFHTVNAAPINPAVDSAEYALIGLRPGNPSYGPGSTIQLSLGVHFESQADGLTQSFNSTSGVTWTATGGTVAGDTYTTILTPGGTNTIRGTFTSEAGTTVLGISTSDTVTATKTIVVDLTAPVTTANLGAPPAGLATVSVTLTNPFSQKLIVDADSLGSGSATSVFDPFADRLSSGRFYISPNSSITAKLGFGYASGNNFDQDGGILLSGTLADGTHVTTPLLGFDLVNGPTTLAGTFASTPEPGSLLLLSMGAAGLLGYGWRRRKRAA